MLVTQILKVNNKKISFTRYGKAWKESAIVFFHGINISKTMLPNMESMSELDDLCIISFDRPGMGEADVIEYYSMEEYFEIVNTVLDRYDVKQIRLIGHNAGGCYAQVYAGLYPERVLSMTLVDSLVQYNCKETKSLVTKRMKRQTRLSQIFKAPYRFYFKKMARRFILHFDELFVGAMKKITLKERHAIYNNYKIVYYAIRGAIRNKGKGLYYDTYALTQKRESVIVNKDIPVDIWYGDKDPYAPESFALYLSEKYDAKHIYKKENLGHLMYFINWKEIVLKSNEL